MKTVWSDGGERCSSTAVWSSLLNSSGISSVSYRYRSYGSFMAAMCTQWNCLSFLSTPAPPSSVVPDWISVIAVVTDVCCALYPRGLRCSARWEQGAPRTEPYSQLYLTANGSPHLSFCVLSLFLLLWFPSLLFFCFVFLNSLYSPFILSSSPIHSVPWLILRCSLCFAVSLLTEAVRQSAASGGSGLLAVRGPWVLASLFWLVIHLWLYCLLVVSWLFSALLQGSSVLLLCGSTPSLSSSQVPSRCLAWLHGFIADWSRWFVFNLLRQRASALSWAPLQDLTFPTVRTN